MQEPLERVTEEMMEAVGPKILRQMGSQLESLQNVIALNPADQEVTDVLGKEATVPEQEAYRRGHQSGWFKGALAFGALRWQAWPFSMLRSPAAQSLDRRRS